MFRSRCLDLRHQLCVLLHNSVEILLDAVEIIRRDARLLLVDLGLQVSVGLFLLANLTHGANELFKLSTQCFQAAVGVHHGRVILVARRSEDQLLRDGVRALQRGRVEVDGLLDVADVVGDLIDVLVLLHNLTRDVHDAVCVHRSIDILVQLGGFFVEDLHTILFVLEVLYHSAHLRAVPLHLLHHQTSFLTPLVQNIFFLTECFDKRLAMRVPLLSEAQQPLAECCALLLHLGDVVACGRQQL
mmetsp:Transcript_22791/g.39358  ORF Transcript_22791/g.39358 Transcript_22791/m.39358 type:complete len:244 (+) Transcript_22791:69-800(+)